ncbi:MAG: phosphatase PAP2 family protein [Planctomycetes bacterium]|nr:phosphatase PAP2 family protein [Planctomycetota bacterium]
MLLVTANQLGQTPDAPPVIHAQVRPAKHDVVLKWNGAALQAIRIDRTPPPVAARNLAILHIAIYDAVMAIERTHQPYLTDATSLQGASAEAAAVVAAHRILAALYPKQRESFDAQLKLCWLDLARDPGRDAGAALGRFVADRTLESRRDDGSTNIGKYSYKNNIGSWRPTAPLHQDALLPEWGYVKPFAIKKGTQHRPADPPALTSVAYADAFQEVKRLGGKDSPARTKEQTEIAIFWADNAGTVTPPGHWNQIAQTLAGDRGNTMVENARLFAHLNIALADAGILCWVIKFTFDFWRPITAIREADRDEKWTPLLDTPPFPAYISGHSTFSGAGAAVLIQSIGTDKVKFATNSDALPDVTRKFTNIWAAAEEAGMSRIYGGIHWQFDNVEGLNVGRTLGEYVFRNTLQPRPRQALRP